MNIEDIREYCLSKPMADEAMPFDDETLVFRVGEKMFALIALEKAAAVNLKCDPERALDLRERHHEITEGYHMSKKHWNTVSLLGNLSDKFIIELIDHSYDLVYKSLPKKIKDQNI
ncbi:MmcQ/YjbR family DNA-binding protein [Bacteroidales bacterium OttesenSCG-928-K03]|nr:MmcQ/YjbR family DNA-binding protein [Odoribacter sp. OttesenSCG-928-L07]MDL2239956.1 MmcQ/YjbR family DNA-binding protein [Bacteroidales bacterium OttesenSCG-928-L14]MDL2240417.1 MmcQ/YjbR family DNA-binding protein [Bacteroidales bacterium OttesenSCG-928-K22]MDL2242983.1 MmcQ/YjbR family DNA-binding protein [Bacteroidales bacterium OttesenSCG-928-K03]